jgi:hypothetical protein
MYSIQGRSYCPSTFMDWNFKFNYLSTVLKRDKPNKWEQVTGEVNYEWFNSKSNKETSVTEYCIYLVIFTTCSLLCYHYCKDFLFIRSENSSSSATALYPSLHVCLFFISSSFYTVHVCNQVSICHKAHSDIYSLYLFFWEFFLRKGDTIVSTPYRSQVTRVVFRCKHFIYLTNAVMKVVSLNHCMVNRISVAAPNTVIQH